MRIYKDFNEARGEIRRDVAEMGIKVHPKSYQDKDIKDDPQFATLELQNYIYTVVDPRVEDLNPTQPWADAEFKERLSRTPINPGIAWKLRRDIWEEFLSENIGLFSYTYSQRMHFQTDTIIREIKANPDSRQLYMAIWNPHADLYRIGMFSRIPCSLGYLFQVRGGELHITYLMRSCDLVTHWENDVYLACKLQQYIANRSGVQLGRFTQYMGSLHVFQKDVEEVF